ncbi:hypothetical protein BOTBODRAFT_510702 [Botryobasidium botryosum FD-172 SS1]|uniref:F-box domain-containing protein n=1 Tax=Botryobasidium botryosum (strain FD-172 SS1) TaxID=930990 RepID=A0A067N3P5_BOTB1|nr:hypothetical protein BOTBODRAFT_510702 [Botryobasidium botryosum FD-172 SS1]
MLESTIQALREQLELSQDPAEKENSTEYSTLFDKVDAECSSIERTRKFVADFVQTYANRRLLILRTNRNEACGIYRLPNEILSKVFELTMEPWPWGYNAEDNPLTLSRVSRRWRYIALGTPRLWSQISPFGSPALVPLFLTRSKSIPLDVVLEEHTARYGDDGLDEEVLSPEHRYRYLVLRKARNHEHIPLIFNVLLVPQFHRLRSLALLDVPEISLNALGSNPAPLLEAFRFEFAERWHQSISLFSGDAPRLRHLHLRRILHPLT